MPALASPGEPNLLPKDTRLSTRITRSHHAVVAVTSTSCVLFNIAGLVLFPSKVICGSFDCLGKVGVR